MLVLRTTALILVSVFLSLCLWHTKAENFNALATNGIGATCTIKTYRRDCGDNFVCLNSTCSYCNVDAECLIMKPNTRCQMRKIYVDDFIAKKTVLSERGFCVYKNLFPDFNFFDGISSITTFIVGVFSSSGGVGGGGAFVPILQGIGRYPSELAIPVSKVMIFGSGLCNLLFVFFDRHPRRDRPLVNYEAAVLMEPSTLLGTVIGVYMNIIFPNWLTNFLVMLFIVYVGYRVFVRGVSIAKKELGPDTSQNRNTIYTGHGAMSLPDLQEDKLLNMKGIGNERFSKRDYTDEEVLSGKEMKTLIKKNELTSEYTPLGMDDQDSNMLQEGSSSSDVTVAQSAILETVVSEIELKQMDRQKEPTNEYVEMEGDGTLIVKEGEHPEISTQVESLFKNLELEKMLENEKHTDWCALYGILIAWLTVVCLSLARGGHGLPSLLGIPVCSVIYWLLAFAIVPVMIIMTIITGIYLLEKHKKRLQVNYHFEEDDVKWNVRNVILYPLLCLVAGIAAGGLGVGGGMVQGPLLLELGLDASVATATSSLMVLFTSSITTLQFTVHGRLPIDYGLWYGFNGFICALVGQFLISNPAKKYRKTFILVFSIFIVIVLSGILMGAFGLTDFITDIQQSAYMGLRSPCD